MVIENPVNWSPLMFPIIECFHIGGFVTLIGTIALVDFRLLGWVMRRQTPGELAEDTGGWTLTGLIVVVCSGLVALISLGLWASVLFGGIFIGFVGRGITF